MVRTWKKLATWFSEKGEQMPVSPYERRNIQRKNPKYYRWLQRKASFTRVLKELKEFIESGNPEDMDYLELQFYYELSELRLLWVNKMNEAQLKNPNWKTPTDYGKLWSDHGSNTGNDVDLNNTPGQLR